MSDTRAKVRIVGTGLVGTRAVETYGGNTKMFHTTDGWNIHFVPVYFSETHEVRWFEQSAVQDIG
ncbi:hypothetical protein ACX80W_01755 [Arthrobacter sp. TMN-37]